MFLAILLFDDISSTKLLLLTKLVTAVQRKNLRHTLQLISKKELYYILLLRIVQLR